MKNPVCVDLDGVLARYDGWKGENFFGEVIEGAVEFTHKLSEKYKVVIHSARTWEEYGDVEILKQRVENWLSANGFYFDEIYIGRGKPYAIGYIDDRGIRCTPQTDNLAFKKALEIVNNEDISKDGE